MLQTLWKILSATWRKLQTFRETTFAMRGNAKPFGKRLSPCAEMPNHSGNDFRHARRNTNFITCSITKNGMQQKTAYHFLF